MKKKSTYYIVKGKDLSGNIVTYISLTDNLLNKTHTVVDTETNFQRAKKKQSLIKLI